ncbi:endonuclease-reverse transcriptase [Plakobranchus ocellatus]|uniref:Endonuclease-reverse transcriptase n=1 Tax=Plakobranchus ocellatus TaxID=259542 RepID=A0AAV3YT42_9GAST|nr:endonuclease-reverse transcriptase [Plakobranchus ocellatus]
MVWTHYSLIWPCQDHHAGYRKWRQKEREAEETLEDNIREWTGLELRNTLRKAEDREPLRELELLKECAADIRAGTLTLVPPDTALGGHYATGGSNRTIRARNKIVIDQEDEEVKDFYNEVQKTLNEQSKKDIIVVQGDGNAKIGQDAQEDWEGTCGQYCNQATNDRGLRLLEFTKYNDLKIMNTFGPHKPSRRWTWHSPGGEYHNQIDYILIKC